ncbi:glycosyl transferase [Paragemmobacter straminiformis]|uniref:Glycosyl transferase n=1 Tax=Paragemmobacter straminiformis TaxID=2045119 RepID=A0A842I601_9RHOB|nr:glycosyl transferase [Gemmobacter straminiformis]MBC2834807.1 glycosyl transferase [Gemmobacter straminiformis]
MEKQVICINWGTKYGPRFINRLYAMVARNITPPFTMTCFTDNPEGVRREVRCLPLPPLDVAMPVNTRGIWPKARLWGPVLGDLTGPVLFMDLDVVVTGSLDDFFTFGAPDDIVLSRNVTNPFERLGQTSVFRFPVGKLVPLQEKFKADPQAVADEYRFEQRYVTRNAPGGVKLFPAAWVRHFRRHCTPVFPLNYWKAPKLEAGTRIVIFPGGFHPEHAISGGWKDEGTQGRTPAQHLKTELGKWREARLFNRLKHYVAPAPWVADHWRE